MSAVPVFRIQSFFLVSQAKVVIGSYRKITRFAREVNGQMSYYLSNKAIVR